MPYAFLSSVDQTRRPPFGERAQVTDAYRAVTLSFGNKASGIQTAHEGRPLTRGEI